MNYRAASVWIVLFPWIAAACAAPDHPVAATATTATTATTQGDDAAPAERTFDRTQHMKASLWLALSARDAVIDGNMNEARSAARALAAHDYGTSVPVAWKKWIGDVQRAAEDVVLAQSLSDAGRAVAAIGLACGNCHYHHDAGPDLEREPPMAWQEPSDTLGERMDRHSVGIDQMWTGLIQPSEDAWRAGTVTLTRAPLSAPQTEGSAVGPRSAAEIELVRNLAKRARIARSYEERAQVYGDLIAGCGHCHTSTPRSL